MLPNGIKKTIILTTIFDGWYISNLLFGGLIGMPIVDPIAEAM